MLNRREMLDAVIGMAVAAATPLVGTASATTYTSREYYCYADVRTTGMDEPVQGKTGNFWFNLRDGRTIKVDSHDYYKFFWLEMNRCFMQNQFFTDIE